jgi:hypothetical protein
MLRIRDTAPDPHLWLTDPDPAIFVTDLQDANKFFFLSFFAYYFLKVHLHQFSLFIDKKS